MSISLKKIIAIFTLFVMMIISTSYAYANISIVNDSELINVQADTLIAKIDKNNLMQKAKDNAIDYSVPVSVRESVVVSANFSPDIGLAHDTIELDVNSTIQKVGEIVNKNGDIANMYVAVGVASEKTDWAYKGQHGIKAWAYVYWIDNFGVENELYAAGTEWRTEDKVVNNREMRYGTSDILGLGWLDGPTVKYPNSNTATYDADYIGLTLRCQTKINVVNVGTVTCNVISGVLSK